MEVLKNTNPETPFSIGDDQFQAIKNLQKILATYLPTIAPTTSPEPGVTFPGTSTAPSPRVPLTGTITAPPPRVQNKGSHHPTAASSW